MNLKKWKITVSQREWLDRWQASYITHKKIIQGVGWKLEGEQGDYLQPHLPFFAGIFMTQQQL